MPVQACTIFVLTGGREVLFCNNEDWSNPQSRIWFVPAPQGRYSCAYVGFDNLGAEGGLNTEGLAFDWVAGFTEKWEPPSSMKFVGGRTSERMLETCANVSEAIAFYRKHREPQFSRAKIMVADKTGASAIIGARNGKLEVLRSKVSRGFGFGREQLAQTLHKRTVPTVASGFEILNVCRQEGENATKYSSIFNLKTGAIHLGLGASEPVELDLSAELRKGPHYYDIPALRSTEAATPKALLSNMRRFLHDALPIEDLEPALTARIESLIRDAMAGAMKSEDYAPEFWAQIEPNRLSIQADLKVFGALASARLVEKGTWQGFQNHGYKLEFKNAIVLQDFRLDPTGKVAAIESRAVEWKN